MSRQWILGCYKPGGTTECSGPALFNGQRIVVAEVDKDARVITQDDFDRAWNTTEYETTHIEQFRLFLKERLFRWSGAETPVAAVEEK